MLCCRVFVVLTSHSIVFILVLCVAIVFYVYTTSHRVLGCTLMDNCLSYIFPEVSKSPKNGKHSLINLANSCGFILSVYSMNLL